MAGHLARAAMDPGRDTVLGRAGTDPAPADHTTRLRAPRPGPTGDRRTVPPRPGPPNPVRWAVWRDAWALRWAAGPSFSFAFCVWADKSTLGAIVAPRNVPETADLMRDMRPDLTK